MSYVFLGCVVVVVCVCFGSWLLTVVFVGVPYCCLVVRIVHRVWLCRGPPSLRSRPPFAKKRNRSQVIGYGTHKNERGSGSGVPVVLPFVLSLNLFFQPEK